jgi:hypothetical protein
MGMFRLPEWIKPHLYTGKKFDDLTPEEVADLRTRISRFRHEDPEVSVMILLTRGEYNQIQGGACRHQQ